jgi:mRNA interferase HigB
LSGRYVNNFDKNNSYLDLKIAKNNKKTIDPILESTVYSISMRIIAKRTLREFWEQPEYSDVQSALEAWHFEALKASWIIPQDIKEKYRSASFLKNNRVVFNMTGNKYRLIVSIDYQRQACFIKFIGTHKQYNAIDAEVYDGYSAH